MLDLLCQLRKFDPGRIFLDGRMGRRLADEQEMPARRLHRLADRLAGVEVVAEIDGIEPCVARAMGGEPTSRRHALAVLLVVPILRHGPPSDMNQWRWCPFGLAATRGRAPRTDVRTGGAR